MSRSERVMGTERMLAPRWIENSVHSKGYSWLMELWDSVRTMCVCERVCVSMSMLSLGERTEGWGVKYIEVRVITHLWVASESPGGSRFQL